MPKNKLTTSQRQELGRATQRKLRARIESGDLPADYYRQLGKRGFAVCLLKRGPAFMATLLSAYYGHPIDVDKLERNREREREHAATRAAYPLEGQVCVRCGKPAQCRDHIKGWQAGHAPENVQLLCADCHRLVSIERVRAG